MKPTTAVLTFLGFLGLTYWAFLAATPPYAPDSGLPETEFSTDRAMEHVRSISTRPHGVGFPAHSEVRRYLVDELKAMGLEAEIQSGYTAGDWGNLSKAVNILARIPGTQKGKALVLLSHYDSSPHSSFGASDAGSGVATILEGVRAFLARGNAPRNDIIILFTDAEELGLNGADLFVNQHPWIRDAGLVLNFEARGSGGASYMLIETNRGNAKLIEAFSEADPPYPVANSLAYSIYKMLPNDTDLTVFREDADIEGFNFAFIDDHYDYHTALDRADRLDPGTLAHQGSYLMPLLAYFAGADLSALKSLDDRIYFNVPMFGLVSYPFEWIWPLMATAALLFLFVLGYGFRNGKLRLKGVAAGFAPLVLIVALNGLAGYFAWPLLKTLYPAYADMLHGFTYNGHLYIAAWSSLALAVCFWAYSLFRKIPLRDLLVAPVLFTLLLCAGLGAYLPGAAFFLVPAFGLLLGWMILVSQDRPNPYLLAFLGIPALWVFAPFVKMLPVGLGLKMMVGGTLMCSLIFFLLLPTLGAYPKKRNFAMAWGAAFLALMLGAHLKSRFTPDTPKPSSLLYVKDLDQNRAHWATYEKVPSEWTRAYLGATPGPPDPLEVGTLSSKYGTGFSFVGQAPLKPVPAPEITVLSDTLLGDQRVIDLRVEPRRDVNRLEVFTGNTPLTAAAVNGIPLSEFYLKNRRGGKLVTHYISENDPTQLRLEFPSREPLELTLYEASNDLLENPLFSVPARPADNLPMPFVLNDAVLLIKKVRFD
jgi:hypothetical protein